MSNLKIWMRVPDDSTLEMWVDPLEHGNDYPWTSRIRILDGQGNERIIDDDELTPGPAKHAIERPEVYSVRLRIVFADDGEGVFHARIVKSNGDVFGSEFELPFEGSTGDVVRGTIGVVTLKEGS